MTRKHAVFNLIRRPILTHEVAVSKNTFLCEAGYHSDNVYHSCAYESLNGVIAFIMTTGVQPCKFVSQLLFFLPSKLHTQHFWFLEDTQMCRVL